MHLFANVKLSFSEVGVATNRLTLVQTSARALLPDERFLSSLSSTKACTKNCGYANFQFLFAD